MDRRDDATLSLSDIEERVREHLTPERFLAWLEAQPKASVVGYSYTPDSGPLHVYLMATALAGLGVADKDLLVSADAAQVYIGTERVNVSVCHELYWYMCETDLGRVGFERSVGAPVYREESITIMREQMGIDEEELPEILSLEDALALHIEIMMGWRVGEPIENEDLIEQVMEQHAALLRVVDSRETRIAELERDLCAVVSMLEVLPVTDGVYQAYERARAALVQKEAA